jgi:hypothetical protein
VQPLPLAPVDDLHPDDRAVGADQASDQRLLPQLGARGDSMSANSSVQVQARQDHSGVRLGEANGIFKRATSFAAHEYLDSAHPLALTQVRKDAHLSEEPDRSPRQPVSAAFVARERFSIQQQHVAASTRQMVSSGRPTRSRANHNNLCVQSVSP